MKLLIIDSNALLHRSFHALPSFTTKNGEPTGAVYGFLLTLFRAIKDVKPVFVAATFDTPAPTFRHKKFKEYKAKRPKAPKEFYSQIPKAKDVLLALSIPVFEKEGFEADDLIATITEKSLKDKLSSDFEIFIVTGDFDTLQLVNDAVKIYTLGRGLKETVIYDKRKVNERFGLSPSQIVDFKALAGDPSDNIPGAPGIGEKTATEILKKYKSIENLYKELEKSPEDFMINSKGRSARIREILLKNKEQVFFSQVLVTTRKDAPIKFDVEKCKFGSFDKEKVKKALENLEFYSLFKRMSLETINEEIKAGKEKQLF